MCVVSMVMDHYEDRWRRRTSPWPWVQPANPQFPPIYPDDQPFIPSVPVPKPLPKPAITQDEIDEFRDLLERAREYDKKNGEPDCEMAEKKRKVKELAEQMGVEIDFI